MSANTSAVSSAKTSSKGPVSTSARPSLKNLGRARVPRAGVIAVSIGIVSALAWKFAISDRHKKDVAAFYKIYDPDRDYARMKAAGVFKSLEGRERPEWLSEYESELDSAIASLKSTVDKALPKKLASAAASGDE